MLQQQCSWERFCRPADDMLRVLGRVCLSVLFLWSAAHCLRHGVEAERAPVAPSLVYAAAVVSAVGALLLLCNLQPRVGSTLLALLLVPTVYIVDVVPLSAVRICNATACSTVLILSGADRTSTNGNSNAVCRCVRPWRVAMWRWLVIDTSAR